MNPQLELRKLMQQELAFSKAKNPSFSLRGLSRKLGLYSSTVSEILNGKRSITSKMARKILEGLSISPDASLKILTAIDRNKKQRNSNGGQQRKFIQINMDHYHVISDWYYYAILSLADTNNFKGDPQWIAKRLGISSQNVQAALDRLERIEMLNRNRKGELVATGLQFKTSSDIANISLRKRHYQNLDLARNSLDQDEVLERDFSFITMAVDPEKLPEIKNRIKKFRRELCDFFESGKRKEVYQLCVQLFPLTKSVEVK